VPQYVVRCDAANQAVIDPDPGILGSEMLVV
jgi:hypothetical protein